MHKNPRYDINSQLVNTGHINMAALSLDPEKKYKYRSKSAQNRMEFNCSLIVLHYLSSDRVIIPDFGKKVGIQSERAIKMGEKGSKDDV